MSESNLMEKVLSNQVRIDSHDEALKRIEIMIESNMNKIYLKIGDLYRKLDEKYATREYVDIRIAETQKDFLSFRTQLEKSQEKEDKRIEKEENSTFQSFVSKIGMDMLNFAIKTAIVGGIIYAFLQSGDFVL